MQTYTFTFACVLKKKVNHKRTAITPCETKDEAALQKSNWFIFSCIHKAWKWLHREAETLHLVKTWENKPILWIDFGEISITTFQTEQGEYRTAPLGEIKLHRELCATLIYHSSKTLLSVGYIPVDIWEIRWCKYERCDRHKFYTTILMFYCKWLTIW